MESRYSEHSQKLANESTTISQTHFTSYTHCHKHLFYAVHHFKTHVYEYLVALFMSRLQTKISYVFLISPMHATYFFHQTNGSRSKFLPQTVPSRLKTII